MLMKEAFIREGSTNPDYKGKTSDNFAATHINLKKGKYASAGDAGLHGVAKGLFRDVETRYRGPKTGRGGYGTLKKDATGAAVYAGKPHQRGAISDIGLKTYRKELGEHLSKSDSAGTYVDDFVHSDNPRFKGKSKKKRIQQALAAYYASRR